MNTNQTTFASVVASASESLEFVLEDMRLHASARYVDDKLMTLEQFAKHVEGFEDTFNDRANGCAEGTTESPFFGYIDEETVAAWYEEYVTRFARYFAH